MTSSGEFPKGVPLQSAGMPIHSSREASCSPVRCIPIRHAGCFGYWMIAGSSGERFRTLLYLMLENWLKLSSVTVVQSHWLEAFERGKALVCHWLITIYSYLCCYMLACCKKWMLHLGKAHWKEIWMGQQTAAYTAQQGVHSTLEYTKVGSCHGGPPAYTLTALWFKALVEEIFQK